MLLSFEEKTKFQIKHRNPFVPITVREDTISKSDNQEKYEIHFKFD